MAMMNLAHLGMPQAFRICRADARPNRQPENPSNFFKKWVLNLGGWI
jgi:hypothetical protein